MVLMRKITFCPRQNERSDARGVERRLGRAPHGVPKVAPRAPRTHSLSHERDGWGQNPLVEATT